jgi:hypothetical protein
MPTLEEYERRVAELETGNEPTGTEDVCSLRNRIFTARWKTTDEQDQAQRLICRLEMLRRAGKTSVGQGAAS